MTTRQQTYAPALRAAWELRDTDPEQARIDLVGLRKHLLVSEMAGILHVTTSDVRQAMRQRIPADYAARLHDEYRQVRALRRRDRAQYTAARTALAGHLQAYVRAGWSWRDVAEALGISRQGAHVFSRIDAPAADYDVPPHGFPPVPAYEPPEPAYRQITALPGEVLDRLRTGVVADYVAARRRRTGKPPAERAEAEVALITACLAVVAEYDVTLPGLSRALGMARYTLSDIGYRHGFDVELPASRKRPIHLSLEADAA